MGKTLPKIMSVPEAMTSLKTSTQNPRVWTSPDKESPKVTNSGFIMARSRTDLESRKKKTPESVPVLARTWVRILALFKNQREAIALSSSLAQEWKDLKICQRLEQVSVQASTEWEIIVTCSTQLALMPSSHQDERIFGFPLKCPGPASTITQKNPQVVWLAEKDKKI